jgi:pilus assembly protein CpaC
MATSTLIRAALASALIVGAATCWPAGAADDGRSAGGGKEAIDGRTPVIQTTGNESGSRFVSLGVGKSIIVDLPRDTKDVLVANPQIANAVVRSARRAYLIGVAVGQTNVFFFDGEGKQIAGFDIAVTRDLNGVRAALKQVLPHADIKVEGIADGVMISGSVANAGESQQAYDIAARLVGDGARVVNGLTVRGRDQVMIRVTVAEVQREVIKQLGIDLNGSLNYGAAVLDLNTQNPFTAFGRPLSDSSISGSIKGVTATLRAMDRAGVLRTLAEPNLTAISGETATFLAGGEFPVPVGNDCAVDSNGRVTCTLKIEFKKFGVGLNFTPVVMSEGRISLKVLTEVSELSQDDALTIAQASTAATITIPSIRVRRADTTLEIPSGGSMVMAGMIQDQTKQHINGTPGLMQVPILGSLFKSRDYINRQTELMIIATPYVVRSVAQKELSQPGDGFADASDPASVLLGRLNRIYGVASRHAHRPRQHPGPRPVYKGSYGFILD